MLRKDESKSLQGSKAAGVLKDRSASERGNAARRMHLHGLQPALHGGFLSRGGPVAAGRECNFFTIFFLFLRVLNLKLY